VTRRTWPVWVALLIFLLWAGSTAPPAGAQNAPTNLLKNPGFEAGFYHWNGINEINVGHDWTPWWAENPDHDPTYLRPEFKEALARDFPYRVRSGERAQQWFKLYSSYIAGIFQQVFDVTPGQNYQFAIHAQVWSSMEDNPSTVSTLPANPHLQIGIDPTGNWDPWSPNIIWSPEASMGQVIDRYGSLTVEATAQNNIITVFVRSIPEFANKHNNVYLDDATLFLVGPPPPPPTNTPLPATETPVASPTLLPTDTPLPTNTPLPTDTPVSTETPLPPTATSPPTSTPEPTATNPPTEPPLPTATEPPAATAEVAALSPEATSPPAGSAEDGENSSSSLNPCASPLLALAALGLITAGKRRRPRL